MPVERQDGRLARRLRAQIVVGALIAASVLAAILVYSAERDDARRANEAIASQAATVADRTVEISAASIRGGEGILRRAGPMPEGGFRRFARDVVATTPLPWLAWQPRVPARERRAFERSLSRPIGALREPTKVNPEGDVRPIPRRNGAYLPMRFVHPDESPQRALLGFDVLFEPARAAAVRAARDSGEEQITVPITEPGQTERAVLVYEPVFEPAARAHTRRQRQLALRGLISGRIEAETIREGIEAQIGPGTDVAVLDGEVPLVPAEGEVEGGERAMIDVLGRTWTVWVEDVERAAILPALAVGGIGFLLAGLVAGLFALAGRREVLLGRERDLAAAEADTQRRTALTLQQALLPPRLPEIPGIESAAAYRAGAEGLEVGGDFYDLFAVGSGWTAVIGDVCGKGAQAAALTALVRHTARAFAERGPREVVAGVNQAIYGNQRSTEFATLCVGALAHGPDGIELTLTVAGHPPPIIARADGTIETVEPNAPLAGVIEDIEIGERRIEPAPGDAIVLYTDGLTEARDRNGAIWGEEGLRAAVVGAIGRTPERMIDAVLARAGERSPSFPRDDVAMLVLRVVGRGRAGVGPG